MPPRSMNAPYSVRFLTMPSTIWPSFRFSSVISFSSARSFSSSTRRDSTMLPRFLLNLMTLNSVRLADERVEVAHRAQVDLRAGQERLHAAADGDREAALHARADDAFDQLVALARGGDLVPDLEAVGLLLREDAQAVFVLAALEEDVDLVARLDPDRAVGLRELVERDHSFGLVADVDDDVVLADVDHAAFDDVAFFDVFVLEGLFEQCREALLLVVVVLSGHRNHAVCLCLSTRRSVWNANEDRASF